jgi:uncharacterized membrane protein HdeD (DUF308 family)
VIAAGLYQFPTEIPLSLQGFRQYRLQRSRELAHLPAEVEQPGKYAQQRKRSAMSDTRGSGLPRGLGYTHIASKWGWFVALGVVLLLAGIFALGDVVAFTLVSVIFIGAMLLVGGIFQIVHAFMTKEWSAFLLDLFVGVLYVLGGFLIMQEPVQGSVVITLLLLAAILVGGIMRIIIALRHRELAAWWLMLLGGIISVILAIMLYASLPWSGLWVLGTLIAVELVVHGVAWLQFGFSLRRLAYSAE